MPAPLTLYVMRHGEVYNPTGILYGRMPNFHLSENGRAQAQAAADYLRDVPISGLYSSPMERAQETATIIAQPHALPIVTDARINESYTPFEGSSHHELQKTMYDIYTGNQPPYERLSDIRRRVLTFITEKRQQHAGETIAMVTHGDVVVTLFMWTKGRDGDDMGRGELRALGLLDAYPATASVNKLVFVSDDAEEIPAYSYHRPYAADEAGI